MKRDQTHRRLRNVILAAGVAVSWPLLAQDHSQHDMAGMQAMPEKTGQNDASRQQSTTSDKAKDDTKGAPDKTAEPSSMDHSNMPGMNHGAMPGMQHGAAAPKTTPGNVGNASDQTTPATGSGGSHGDHDMPAMDAAGKTSTPEAAAGSAMDAGMNMPDSGSMEMGPMQGGRAPANARDPDAYAEGLRRHAMKGMEMGDDASFGRVLFNELEYARGSGSRGQVVDAEAWYGGDYNKAWFKLEAERQGGKLESSRSEALWDRVFATFWSTQLGVRHDTGPGGSKNWLAFGVRGLAPYWFDTEATLYVGSSGALAARAEMRYELLLTQRLILQPQVEANFYSKDDPQREVGAGLSELDLGLRLRYEIRRQFAPYVGVSWKRQFGGTADYARQAGERVRSTQWVAGVRIWF